MEKKFSPRLALVGLAGASLVALATLGFGVQSQSLAATATQGPEFQEKAAVAMAEYAPSVVTLEDGTMIQAVPNDPYMWNTAVLNGEGRGCNACHESILAATQELEMPHPELWNPYGVEPTIKFCYMCHSKALFFQDSMHAIHNLNPAFAGMGGSCESCHYVSPATGEYLMWDLAKYNVAYMGITSLAAPMGEFSFTQDTITPLDDLFFYWENNDHRGVTPNNEVSDEVFDNWEISVGGDVENPFTFRLGDYADQMVTMTVKMDCQTNPPNGAYVANVEVTGIPISVIMADAGVSPEATNMHTVADDGWDVYPLPLSFVRENIDSMLLVTAINGERIEMLQGFPVQFWAVPAGGCHYTKRVVAINFTTDAADAKIFRGFTNPKTGEMFNKPNTSIFRYANGTIFNLGDTIEFEGFVDAYDVPVTAVEISFDKGNTWTTYELGETDITRWINWKYDFTPEKAGSYLMMVRGVAADGTVSTDPSQLFFVVK